ncbi:glycosyltransferase family 4 protein [Apibacter adventoris]|uniref:glycosyltransferase family 4 protein n=1 Tax=Apibacter adventoris TaxID=1679466 RepID=UPI000CF62D4F|nr:MraY family glycosyltransferase [Apibacter adventoris]PQL95666.1 undecaprenyl/decaprenyl-phosphate alpha-N-acetylglucosaminyl 1-phosphate transferase [Apibacter adventoris]
MNEFDIRDLKNIFGINSFYLKCFLGLVGSFLLTYISIPKIIKISYKKDLMALPGERSSHNKRTPNLGGIAIFYSITIMSSICAYELFSSYIFLFSSIIILFFIGLMDDILVVTPNKKLYAQIIASLMISIGSNVRIGSFFGIFGIETLPYGISIIFTVIIFIFLINAYNLVDGIDGLASGIALLACCAFIFTFWRLGSINYPMIVLALTIIGSLLAFLRFNFNKKYKIFMGDTGSMIIGFLLSFMGIKFLNLFLILSPFGTPIYHLQSAPVIVIAILIIPIIDTIGVFIIRILKGNSPFRGDKNHMHHRYLRLGLDHKKVSLIMISENALIILTAYFLRHIKVHLLLLIILTLGLIFSFLPLLITKSNKNKN